MKLKPFTLAVTYWITIIVITHFFAPPGYVWTQNTISELASQGHADKWIMQVGIIGFGALIMFGFGWASWKANRIIYSLLPVALYGLFILLSGIYCAAPIDPAIPYSDPEAKLHSVFATTGGISLSLGILWHAFISRTERERWTHLLLFVAVVGLSALFSLVENSVVDFGTGIIQRLLYISGFAWLVYQERMFIALHRL